LALRRSYDPPSSESERMNRSRPWLEPFSARKSLTSDALFPPGSAAEAQDAPVLMVGPNRWFSEPEFYMETLKMYKLSSIKFTAQIMLK